jgi:hypothetical protein
MMVSWETAGRVREQSYLLMLVACRKACQPRKGTSSLLLLPLTICIRGKKVD